VLVMFSLFCPLPCLEVEKIMRTLLILETNSNTPRRHGSGQNNENIANTRGKLEHSTKTCSSLSLVLVMFSLFCPLPCLRGVLEFAPSISNALIILSTSILTLEANSSIPRRHGSGQNNESITNTKCNSSTPRRHGSNVLIIFSTSMSSWSVRAGP
jgi:hypothetical protein